MRQLKPLRGAGRTTKGNDNGKVKAMIARTDIDKCFSTARNGHNPFNFDGQERTELSVEEARTAFDFTIEKKKSFDENGREIPNFYHLQDSDGNIIPSVALRDGFTPIQHIDTFDYITNEVLPKIPDMKLEMAGTIRGRSTGVFAAKFGDTFCVKGDKSESELRLFFCNPTNGTGTMNIGFTHVRVVCQNTLRAAIAESKQDGFKIYHTKFAALETHKILNTIAKQAEAALEMKARCERLAEIGVDSETVARVLDAVYPLRGLPEESFAYARMKNLREQVMHQFEGGETAMTMDDAKTGWGLFNSFTFPIFNPDEKKLAKSKTKDKTEIAFKGMNGSVAEKVDKIFNKVERVLVYA